MKRRRNGTKSRTKPPTSKASALETTLLEATLAHRRRDLKSAARGYRRVLQLRPEWGQVWNAIATVFMDQGHMEAATEALNRALEAAEPYAPALYNLGRIRQLAGDLDGAATAYETLIQAQPDFGLAWNNMGTIHRERGNPAEGLRCFRKAARLAPEAPEVWNNLGVALDEENLLEEAMRAYQEALKLDPLHISANFNLGLVLQKLGRHADAEARYRAVLDVRPKDTAARFMLQSLGCLDAPRAAPVDYVRRVFDGCAGNFDRVLVHDLKYRTPERLFAIVRPHLRPGMTILDLGCGTGLGAAMYRPFARRFVGMDASVKMLEQARTKKIYDELKNMDMLDAWNLGEPFDLITGSDVFVYVGDLGSVIGPASAALHPGGLLAFSVELIGEGHRPYRLRPTGRYAHSAAYVTGILYERGFEVLESVETVLREEGGKPVGGLLIVARWIQDRLHAGEETGPPAEEEDCRKIKASGRHGTGVSRTQAPPFRPEKTAGKEQP